MKKILISLLGSIMIVILSVIIGGLIYVKPPVESSIDPNVIIIGDSPPAWWSTGLPFGIFYYNDCQAGCLPVLNPISIFIDILFWFFVILVILNKNNYKKTK